MNEVSVLIISNKFDFTTDYVVLALRELGIPYVRVNRDEFLNYSIRFLVNQGELYIRIGNEDFVILAKSLKSVYYRAPTFIRTLDVPTEPELQLYKFQWASFIRNLIFFEDAFWINNPVATYKAENKLYQLKIAKDVGFKIPNTLVSNDAGYLQINDKREYAIKTLDPGLLKISGKSAFIYTNIVTYNELMESNLRFAPVVVQEYLHPKTDIRVTVVGDRVFAVKILSQGNSINGDWRRIEKDKLEYVPVTLPENITQLCIKFLRKLDLIFGAIDLVCIDDEYYFLEVNPTGEWAWLVKSVKFPIHKEIANLLFKGKL